MFKIEELLELARARRTVRGYLDKDVPQELIDRILDVARWAPSGANSQPWEFVVIRDPQMKQRIFELFEKQSQIGKEIETAGRGSTTTSMGMTGFLHAPVWVLVLGDRRVNESFPVQTQHDTGEQHFISGLASATLLIHLAATSLGLASQWVSSTGSTYVSTLVKSWLGIPQHLKLYDMIPIGYSSKAPKAPPRRSLEEIVHREAYDPQKARSDADIQSFLMKQTRLGKYGMASQDETGAASI